MVNMINTTTIITTHIELQKFKNPIEILFLIVSLIDEQLVMDYHKLFYSKTPVT